MSAASDDAIRFLDQAVTVLHSVEDPIDRVVAATAFMSALSHAGDDVKVLRRDAMVVLHEAGYGYGQIADIVGLSKPRVQQVLAGLTPPPRPGKIEVNARLEATRLRAEGRTNRQVADRLVPWVRQQRGGMKLSSATIAGMLDVPESMVETVERKQKARRGV